jgi:hypothetical protein
MVSAPLLVALEIARVSSEAALLWMFGRACAVYHSSSMGGGTQKSLQRMGSTGGFERRCGQRLSYAHGACGDRQP